MIGLFLLGALASLLLVLLLCHDFRGRKAQVPEVKGWPILGYGPKLAFMPIRGSVSCVMLPVLYLSALVAVVLAVILLGWLLPSSSGIPGPKGLPLLGIGPMMAFLPLRDVYPWIQEMIALYGGAFQANISGFKTLIVTDPIELEIVLSSVNYIQKGYEYFILKPWLREGLLLSDGSKWHQRRKLLTPTFHFKILEDSLCRQADNAERFVDKLLQNAGKPYKVEEAVRASTLDIICETALGLNMDVMDNQKKGYVSAIKRITEEATEWFLSFWLHNNIIFSLSNLGKSYYKDVNTIHKFSEKVIVDRKDEYIKTKAVKDENDDGVKRKFAFLDRLLQLDAENPGLLSQVDIQEEVDTFTFEGHDTTAAALVFSIFLLANHPDAQERAAEEQTGIFGSSKRVPSKQDLQEMSYLEMVIKETLRLYPSVPIISRRLTKDLVLSNGSVVPPGYNVMMFPMFVHRNPVHWEEPELFRPERFSPGVERHPFSYIPFSAGPRNCIGQKFAMMEMKMILSALLRRCKLEPVTKSVKIIPNIIMKSEEPVFVRVLPRN